MKQFIVVCLVACVVLAGSMSFAQDIRFLRYIDLLPELHQFSIDKEEIAEEIRLNMSETNFESVKSRSVHLESDFPGYKKFTQRLAGNEFFDHISLNYMFGETFDRNIVLDAQQAQEFVTRMKNRIHFLREKSILFRNNSIIVSEKYDNALVDIIEFYTLKYGAPINSELLVRSFPGIQFEEYFVYIDWAINDYSMMRLCFSPVENLFENSFFVLLIYSDSENFKDVFPNRIPDGFEKEITSLRESELSRYWDIVQNKLQEKQ